MRLKKEERGLPAHKLLRALRARQAVHQSALAAAIGVDKSYISKVENGERQVTLSLSKRLGKFFNVNPAVFLDFN